MLVLSRKVNEEIIIGDTIRVRLVKVGGGRARLGITAPPDVSVRRAELAKKTVSEREPAHGFAEPQGHSVPSEW